MSEPQNNNQNPTFIEYLSGPPSVGDTVRLDPYGEDPGFSYPRDRVVLSVTPYTGRYKEHFTHWVTVTAPHLKAGKETLPYKFLQQI